MRKRRPEDPQATKKHRLAYQARHPEKHREIERKAQLKRRYGITLAQYEEMFASQNGVCAICRKMCNTGRRLAVDHDHALGVVRGLLCRRCNLMLGNATDEPLFLRAGADYLEKAKQCP